MYQPMLYLHWKQVRYGLIPFVLAAYALPLLAVQGFGGGFDPTAIAAGAYRSAVGFNYWLPFFPALAAATGATLALSAWNWDHQLKHVYALSLPVSRWRYAMLKMGAGAVLALIPTAAFGLGCAVAVLSVDLPMGLHAYPLELTLRFFLGTLLAYSALFALAAGTVRTTGILLSVVVVGVLVSGPLTEALANVNPYWEGVHVMEWAMTRLIEAPGPLQIFTGNWSLIDV